MPKKTRKRQVIEVANRLLSNQKTAYYRLFRRSQFGQPSLKECPDPLIAIAADITLLMELLYKDGHMLLDKAETRE